MILWRNFSRFDRKKRYRRVMPPTFRSLRQEQQALSAAARAKHQTWGEIARDFAQRYNVNMRVAFRLARGWSQREVSERWNAAWPTEVKSPKAISYWETWPAATGHEPSIVVLGRLAELYECSVSDLLADCADFRASDPAFVAAQQLATADGRMDGSSSVAALVEKLGHNSAVSADEAVAVSQVHDSGAGLPDMAGIWLSRYHYPSTGRDGDFVGEHYVVMHQSRDSLTAQSVPAENGSVLMLDLNVRGTVATGTWVEKTSPGGYYRGSVYHGALQLVIDPMGKSMRGRWVGFDREFAVSSDVWELHWVEEASTAQVLQGYHLKV